VVIFHKLHFVLVHNLKVTYDRPYLYMPWRIILSSVVTTASVFCISNLYQWSIL